MHFGSTLAGVAPLIPVGCPAFVPGFPLCGHGRVPILMPAEMPARGDCRSKGGLKESRYGSCFRV